MDNKKIPSNPGFNGKDEIIFNYVLGHIIDNQFWMSRKEIEYIFHQKVLDFNKIVTDETRIELIHLNVRDILDMLYYIYSERECVKNPELFYDNNIKPLIRDK